MARCALPFYSHLSEKGIILPNLQNGEEIVLKRIEPFRPLGQDDPIWDLAGVIDDKPDIGVRHDVYVVQDIPRMDTLEEDGKR